MSDATISQLIIAGTAILSAGLGLAGGVVIEQLRTRRDLAARTEARRDQRDDSQRQTLLELQEAVAHYARLVVQSHHHDAIAFDTTGEWGKTPRGDDLDEDFRLAQMRSRLLAERVRDDQLRSFIYGFTNRGVLATMAPTKDKATQGMDDWMESMARVQDRLGEILRTFL
jgi:hypothetical protein